MITLQSLSRDVKASRGAVTARINKKLGGMPEVFTEEFRQRIIKDFKDEPLVRHIGKTKPESATQFKKAFKVLKKEGYIKPAKLKEIFKGSSLYTTLNTFDRFGEPIYEDTVGVTFDYRGNKKTRNIIVYKLLNPVFDKWREEAKGLPNRNGIVPNNGKRIY